MTSATATTERTTERLIGQAFKELGLLTEAQIQQALDAQPKHKLRLGELAVSLGMMSETDLARALGEFFNVPHAELTDSDDLDLQVVELLPEALARRYGVILTKKEGEAVTLAMADPLDVRAIDAVRLQTSCRVRKQVTSRGSIMKAIDRSYHAASRIAKSMDHLLAGEHTLADAAGAEIVADLDKEVSDAPSPEESGDLQLDQLKNEASHAPVVQFVNLLLMRAVQERASDIHIEPEEHAVTIRLRVDGMLREVAAPPKHMLQAIVTRIKLLGNLDIAERRLPQDGRFKFRVFDKTIDVRLSSLPTVYGEKLVLRILDRSGLILDMQSLGFEPGMLETFNKCLTLPHGLVILTGPTGSGKTTTLYAALNSIKTPTKNIVTIEDPVEYQLAKINQVHTKADIGLTFAAGLRSILRQDPDIIMVGEIRDRETAEICIRSALTGHLVLSTLHTNYSVSAISGLTDMGIERYLLTASLTIVMAQRLVRRICDECAAPWEPTPELLARIKGIIGHETSGKSHGASNGSANGSAWKFRKGKGCKRCGNSGYYGRIAIYEQFVVGDTVKTLLADGAAMGQIKQAARKDGLQTLLHSALNKVRDGVTTLDEAFSVCATQSEMFE